MEGAADSIITLNHFPVAIDRKLRATTPIVHDTLPHLQTKNRESENEKLIQYQNVAELTNRVQQSINQHLHAGHG